MAEKQQSLYSKLVGNGDVKLNRKLGVYLVCLMLACVLWMLVTLADSYETDIVFPVSYNGIPANRVVTNNLPESITAKVHSVGFSLLWYKLRGGGETLTIDIPPSKMKQVEGMYYTVPNHRLDKISSQLGNKIKVLKISPDTIYVSFAEKMKKKLKVKTDISLSLQKQHGLADSIRIEPEYVNVTGPKNIVEKMESAETENISLKNINDKQELSVGFEKAANTPGLTFSPEKVKVSIPVEKYTEGYKEIAVTVINLPKGSRLKVYPEKVKITYLVGLSNYDKLEPAMFAVGFNYKNLPKGKSNKIKVELLNAPSYINSVKIEPSSVEYIIQK